MEERRVRPLLFGAEVVRFFGLGFFFSPVGFDDFEDEAEATPFLPTIEVRRVSVLAPPVREMPETRLVDFRIFVSSTDKQRYQMILESIRQGQFLAQVSVKKEDLRNFCFASPQRDTIIESGRKQKQDCGSLV